MRTEKNHRSAKTVKSLRSKSFPVEALLKPGESIEYKINAFNAKGQKLDTPDNVTLRVEGQRRDRSTATS